jgi:prepilin-type processing-associated H-X9-DG protein
MRHLNHDAKRVNVLYADGSVAAFDNSRNTFSIRAEDFADYPVRLFSRLDAVLRSADRGYISESAAREDPNGEP